MKASILIVNVNKLLHIFLLSGLLCCFVQLLTKTTFLFFVITVLFTITYVLILLSEYTKKRIVAKSSDPVPEKPVINETGNTNDVQQIASFMQSSVTEIPVLTEQLKAVIGQTDSAAEGLTTAFIGINRQAKKQLQSVLELFGNLSEKSGGSSLSETQQELQEIQKNYSVMTSFFDSSIGMISDVVSQLSRVDEFALKIKKIGQMTNILALNAAIEAAHTGSAGSGFKVIATEINALSKDSNSSIMEISEITENLTSKVNQIKAELESVHKDTMHISSRTDELFGLAMGKINETLQDATSKMGTIAGDAEVLNKEISKIVVSIQFQDITRQRIEHVISPLETIQKEITDIIKKLEDEGKYSIQNSINSSTGSLEERYTMESEREVLRNIQNVKS